MATSSPPLPKAFIWRRLHSLTGLWLVLFLIIHLLANSQAALLFGENGSGFVKAANDIHNLPYLPALEIILLGIPFAIHMIWGVQYLFTGKFNAFPSDGSKPSLPEYPRNQAYTWQRITSWILLFAVTAHVVHMRFIEKPSYAQKGTESYYVVRVQNDRGLEPLAARLGVKLYTASQVAQEKSRFEGLQKPDPANLLLTQDYQQDKDWIEALEARPLKKGEVAAVSNNFGMAELLMVRETFKVPVMIFLYTGLVLSACFHAFNGLWTFLITWGATLSVRAQNLSRKVATGLMFLIAFLGLAAIWGTYWINLKQ